MFPRLVLSFFLAICAAGGKQQERSLSFKIGSVS